MKRKCRCSLFFIKKDIIHILTENKRELILTILFSVCGIGLGIYLAVNTSEQIPPISVFSCIFRGEYSPFSLTFRYLIRFIFYFFISTIGFFLVPSWLFSGISILLFSKFWSQLSAVCISFDPLPSAILSILLIYIPLWIFGVYLFFLYYLKIREHRLCSGNKATISLLRSVLSEIFLLILAYFLLLILLFTVLCGIVYFAFVSF